MNTKYDAVIFDLDGTLVDSMWVWAQLDIDYLAKFGIVAPEDIDKELEGKSFTESAGYFKERFELPHTIEEIKASWNEMAWDFYMNEVRLKEGVYEFLTFLYDKGIKLGIATSNSVELVETVLKQLEIRHYFESVRTSCQVEKGKPYPYIYLKVADDLNVKPHRCLVFEDIPNGILAGKAAGMEVWGVNDRQDEETRKRVIDLSDRFIDNYFEAIEILS
ncbi:MAG: HAD family phosphatase [Cellulosilyticaceae bacterium]